MWHTEGVRLIALLFVCSLVFSQKLPLATFNGTIHGASSKHITIETAEGNLVDFDINKKTRVMRGKKEISASELATGDAVTIEARQEMLEFLIAVTITVQPKP